MAQLKSFGHRVHLLPRRICSAAVAEHGRGVYLRAISPEGSLYGQQIDDTCRTNPGGDDALETQRPAARKGTGSLSFLHWTLGILWLPLAEASDILFDCRV